MTKVITLYSGGMDSYTLLLYLLETYSSNDVRAISFNYGQRHVKELIYADAGARRLNVVHKIVSLQNISDVFQGSALTREDIEVPEGHYEDESMKVTVVPNRNMIMLSIAVAWAVSVEAEKVYYAAHAGDHAIYPDCRPKFVYAMNEVAKIANYHPVSVFAPFQEMTKGDIAKYGVEQLSIDYDAHTWTCYKGLDEPCGKCGACVERKEALTFAGYTALIPNPSFKEDL